MNDLSILQSNSTGESQQNLAQLLPPKKQNQARTETQQIHGFQQHSGNIHRTLSKKYACQDAKVWDVSPAGSRELATLLGFEGGFLEGPRLFTVRFISPLEVEIQTWDLASDGKSNRISSVISSHEAPIIAGNISPDETRLVTVDLGNTVKVWSATTGRELSAFAVNHTEAVTGVAFIGDGHRVATSSDDGTVKIWDAASGRELLILSNHTSPVSAFAFNTYGTRIATAGADGTAKVWDGARRCSSRPTISTMSRCSPTTSWFWWRDTSWPVARWPCLRRAPASVEWRDSRAADRADLPGAGGTGPGRRCPPDHPGGRRMTVRALLRFEPETTARGRALTVVAAGFALASLVVALAGLSAGGVVAVQGFARTSVSLLQLVVWTVPMLALLTGAVAGADTHDLEFLVALPVSRERRLVARWLAHLTALGGPLLAGLGVAGLLVAALAGTADATRYLALVGVAPAAHFEGYVFGGPGLKADVL